ncbi:MAG TPA: hypothetical protein VK815_18010 [Candidatus Acidoferrales bacterium]|nr:hypothetical protein [Candidatus Acidoferrales bacterium]
MEPLQVGDGRGGVKLAEKIRITVFPRGHISGTTQPAFLLEEMKKDKAAQQLFDEVAHRLQRVVAGFIRQTPQWQFENLGRCVASEQMVAKFLVVRLVSVEKFAVDLLDGKGVGDLLQPGRVALFG